jgi:uncharacterized membrane protein YfcA
MDWMHTLSGFVVGSVVGTVIGRTGVGGGLLMTLQRVLPLGVPCCCGSAAS